VNEGDHWRSTISTRGSRCASLLRFSSSLPLTQSVHTSPPALAAITPRLSRMRCRGASPRYDFHRLLLRIILLSSHLSLASPALVVVGRIVHSRRHGISEYDRPCERCWIRYMNMNRMKRRWYARRGRILLGRRMRRRERFGRAPFRAAGRYASWP